MDGHAVAAILTVLCIISAPFALEAASAVDLPTPRISDVSVVYSNQSGIFRFDLYINGTNEGAAKGMNFTFSVENGTGAMDGPWLGPVDLILFGNGISFKAVGTGNDTWSKWRFHLQVTYDISKGPGMITNLFGGLLGVNISDVDPGRIDEVDINDTRVYFLVRSYGPDGGHDEARTEITDELRSAFVPAPGPDDGGGAGGGSEEDLTLPIVLIAVGAILIIASAIAWIRYSRRKGRNRSSLGYTHERF
jgi:hypothetical protein